MLRKTVQISEWMVEYIEMVSQIYGLNYSENVRFMLACMIITMITKFYPEIKSRHNHEYCVEMFKNFRDKKIDRLQFEFFLDEIEFEARKAVEQRMALANHPQSSRK